MTLQFNPESYFQAYQKGQQAKEYNRTRPLDDINQALQMINQTAGSYRQENDAREQSALSQAFAAGDKGYDPMTIYRAMGGKRYLQNAVAPTATQPVSPMQDQTQTPSQPWGQGTDPIAQMNPNSINANMPAPQQEASAGVSDMPSNPILNRSPMVDNFNQFASTVGHPQIPHPQPQQPTNIFSRTPVDYNTVISKLKNGDLSGWAGLNEKQKADIKELPQYKAYTNKLEAKPEGSITIDQASTLIPGLDKNRLAQVYPDGTIPKDHFALLTGGYKTDDKEMQQQDKLEQEYRQLKTKAFSNRSGGLGLQDAKVNSAIHARQLIDSATDPKTGEININQITSPELAMSLASLVSGGNTPALETIKEMTPQSLNGFVKSQIGYLFGKPVDVLPQEWAQNLKHMIDRQGVTSEGLRDKYLKDLAAQAPTRLAKDRRAKLDAEDIGTSYSKTFGVNPIKLDQGSQIGASQQPIIQRNKRTGQVRQSFDGGQTWQMQ